jgi:hypothetical protein
MNGNGNGNHPAQDDRGDYLGNGRYEKHFWQSKKFIAAMTFKICWLLVEIACLGLIYLSPDQKLTLLWASVLIGIFVLDGFIQAGFLGGQTWLDKYVRVAEITTSTVVDAITPEDGDNNGGGGGSGGSPPPRPPPSPGGGGYLDPMGSENPGQFEPGPGFEVDPGQDLEPVDGGYHDFSDVDLSDADNPTPPGPSHLFRRTRTK